MRVAVGVDIVEVSRVQRLLADNSAAEAEIFTEAELAYCNGKKRRFAHLAARFAAKEAVLKALGTGLGPGRRWTDVEVRNDPLGRPHLLLHGDPARQLADCGGQVEISLSHTGEHAIAYASVLHLGAVPAPFSCSAA